MKILKLKELKWNIGFMVLVLILMGTVISCGDEETPDEPGFDRGAMLSDMANELIIPNFEALQASVDQLASSVSSFNENTNQANLDAMREAWAAAVMDFQHTSAFGFGPGNFPLGPFASVLGAFPVDEAQVEQNMGNPDFDLSASFDRDVRGFYTVEYLIYGVELSDDEILAGFNQERQAYLDLITDELKTSIDGIVSEWKGDYLNLFINNDGTSAGSSVSQLYNEWVKDYENLKNFKVELPAGLTAGQAASDPTLVEAFYSGISNELIEAHFENSKDIYFGRSRSGTDFTGFVDYLNSVMGGPELVTTTEEAISQIDGAIADLPAGRLSDHVEDPEVETLRDELQANTPNFKSSMSSLLGISITFNSGDGD